MSVALHWSCPVWIPLVVVPGLHGLEGCTQGEASGRVRSNIQPRPQQACGHPLSRVLALLLLPEFVLQLPVYFMEERRLFCNLPCAECTFLGGLVGRPLLLLLLLLLEMDGSVDGWLVGWMVGWMDGCVGGWMDGSVSGWVDGWMGG